MRSLGAGLRQLCVLAAITIGVVAPAQPPLHQLRDPIPPHLVGSPAFADVDADGDADLVLLSDGVLLNDGHAHFAPISQGALAGIGAVGALPGDLNGDYHEDIVVQTWAGAPSLLFAQPGGQLLGAATPLPPTPAPGNWRLALGDVDGDGDLDLFGGGSQLCFVGAGWNCPAPAFLWLNDGMGSFSDASFQLPSLALSVIGCALFDCDGDGDQDAFVVQDLSSSIPPVPPTERFLLLNDGLGSFSLGPTAPASLVPGLTSIAVADADGDGDQDLHLGSLQPELLINDGAGVFTRPGVSTAQGLAHYFLADLGGDGIPELLRCSLGTVTVHAFDGVGSYGLAVQGFGDPQATFGAVVVPRAALGDADADGDLDLYVEEVNGPRLFLNDGQGGLQPSSGTLSFGMGGSSWALGDLEGDGDPDLLSWSVSGLRLATNDGRGVLTQQLGASVPGTSAGIPPEGVMELVDVDGDGDLDLYLASSMSSFPTPQLDTFVRNDGNLVFVPSVAVAGSGDTRQMVSGDLDGDGDLDLVQGRSSSGGPTTGGPGRQNRLVMNATTGSTALFVPSLLPSPADHTQALVLADVDSDSDLDIVEANSGLVPGPSATRILLNDGAGGFSLSPWVLPAASSVAAGDVDQDGDVDLFLDAQLRLGDGLGGFTPGTPLFAAVVAIALADLDGDGDLDAASSTGTGALDAWWNDGTGSFSAAGTVPGFAGWWWPRLRFDDLDHDGDRDLVTAGPRIYTNTTRQVARRTLPRLGRPLEIEIAGLPGSPYLLFAAPLPGWLPLPPFGTVAIDPPTAVEMAAGSIGPSGRSTASFLVPSAPWLAGAQLHWQAGLAMPPVLTNGETTTLVAP